MLDGTPMKKMIDWFTSEFGAEVTPEIQVQLNEFLEKEREFAEKVYYDGMNWKKHDYPNFNHRYREIFKTENNEQQ